MNKFPTQGEVAYDLTGYHLLHKQGFKGQGVKVAVLDTGCNHHHPFFQGAIKETDNSYFNYAPDVEKDETGHGTHVCGTIHKLAPKAEIIPYKVLNPMGGSSTTLAKAINDIVQRGDIDIISMSLSTSQDDPMLKMAIELANEHSIFMNVASGNTGKLDDRYPACYPQTTTWGAVDVFKNEAYFSTESNEVDLVQVGVDVWSCDKDGESFVKKSGTSMATPMGTGMSALLMSKHKALFGERPSGRLLNHFLKMSAIDIGLDGIDTKSGYGFVSLDPNVNLIKLKIGEKNLKVNDDIVKMDTETIINDDDRTLIPVRFVLEAMGRQVYWLGETKEVLVV